MVKKSAPFDIELADGKPDWWAFLDATPFLGKTVTIKVDKLPESSKGLSSIDQSDKIKSIKNLYRESLRPQFHFTSRHGWFERSERAGLFRRRISFVLPAQSLWLELGKHALGAMP